MIRLRGGWLLAVGLLAMGCGEGAKPSDVGAEPSDIGAEPGDSGAEPSDAGAEPSDTGAEPSDAGAEPSDTGAEPSDTSAEPSDSGAEPPDTGAEPSDVGEEPTDTGTEPTDTGAEPTDAGAGPVNGEGTWCCTLDEDEESLCPLRVVRMSAQDTPASSIQLLLTWDVGLGKPVGAVDEWCFEGGQCFDVPVPPNGLYPHGHALALSPSNLEEWDGEGGFFTTLFASPIPPLSLAYFGENGEIVGDDAVLFRMRISHASPPATQELCFSASGVVASGGRAEPLAAGFWNDVLVTW